MRRLLVLLLFVLVLAGGAVVTWKAMGQAKLVQEDLTTARALLARAGGLQSGELDQRLELIDQARAHTTSAQQRLQRWPLRHLGVVPWPAATSGWRRPWPRPRPGRPGRPARW